MKLNKPLSIQIYFHNPTTAELTSLGISVANATILREMTFYEIDNISWSSLGTTREICGGIQSGGEFFNTPILYKELKELILEFI